MAKTKQRPNWQNRIIESGVKPANQFLAHPNNPRTHPNVQRDVMRGVLDEIGWVGSVIENKRTGYVIDGHLRIEEALSRDENEPVPYTLVDLSPEEEALALAVHDEIGGMAVQDYRLQQELLNDLNAENQALDAMIDEMRVNSAQFIDQAGENDGTGDYTAIGRNPVVKVALSVREASIIEAALMVTGERNRGAALTEICREYLYAKGQLDLIEEGELETATA